MCENRSKMQIILVGINGKMGQEIVKIAPNDNIKIVAGIDINGNKKGIFNNFNLPQKIINNTDAVLDFAGKDAIEEEVNFCVNNNLKLIICSTGHTKKQLNMIKRASKKIPIFLAPNTSFGVLLINKILRDNLKYLKKYDISLIEKHHEKKQDKPSGTAKLILKTLQPLSKEIECYSLRKGSVFGEHQVLLFGSGEQIIIKHTSESRELFARGALDILKYMQNVSRPRLYIMEDFVY